MLDIDQAVQAAFNAHAMPGYGLFFYAITLLGSAYLWIAVLTIALLSGQWKKIAAILIIVIVSGMVVNEDLKDIVQRMRPGDVWGGSYFSLHNYSFPSGHTETAFIIATVLSAFIAWRYSLVTYLLALAVGVSRMYLGVHYFTDVIGGAITGIAIGWLTIIALYKIGLVKNNVLASKICYAMNIHVIDTSQETDTTRAFVSLFFGLAAAMVLLLTGEYILSMAALSFTYIRLLTGTGQPGKAVTHGPQ